MSSTLLVRCIVRLYNPRSCNAISQCFHAAIFINSSFVHPPSSCVAILCHFSFHLPPSLPHLHILFPRQLNAFLHPFHHPCFSSEIPRSPFQEHLLPSKVHLHHAQQPGESDSRYQLGEQQTRKGRMSYHDPLGSNEGGNEEECPISMSLFLC